MGTQALGPEERRLVEKMILDGKRAGLALPEKEREELTKLKKDLSQACLEFNVGGGFTPRIGLTTEPLPHICRKTSMRKRLPSFLGLCSN